MAQLRIALGSGVRAAGPAGGRGEVVGVGVVFGTPSVDLI